MAGWQVGIDIGGTFTDVVACNMATRQVVSTKVKTVRTDPIKSLLAGLEAVGLRWDDVDDLIHGTTVVTNAIVEQRLAKVAFITTLGFADVLTIGRQNRRYLYRLDLLPKLAPLVPRARCLEIDERLDFRGNVVRGVERQSLDKLLADLRALDIEAVAISLLHSYANPVHEKDLLEAIKAVIPHVALSHRVNPESREFERANTTVLSAAVMPLVANYVDQLEERKPVQSRLHFFHSASGLCSSKIVRELPLTLALSGPAAGVAAASRVAQNLKIEQALTFDMGGTTTDVCMISHGSAEITADRSLAGQPLRMPAVAVESIGAGGGSLVRLDGGVLKVGPDSVGADPGPACYGLGGELPTVSDANMVLGFLEDGATFGGNICLSRGRAEKAIAPIADALGLSVVSTALGILKVANSAMANALRRATVERGIDVRSCVLIAFGGAGPMHAVEVARLVGIQRVIVPEHSSALSALGCVTADISHTQHQTTQLSKAAWSFERLEAIRSGMLENTGRLMGHTNQVPTFKWVAAVRYVGQSYAVEIVDPNLENTQALEQEFKARHAQLYGFATDELWEIVALRLTATVERHVASQLLPPMSGTSSSPARFRECYFNDMTSVRVAEYDRPLLSRGVLLTGPAIISDKMSTLILPPKYDVMVNEAGHLDIKLEVVS